MILTALLAALVAATLAADVPHVPIISQDSVIDPQGSYHYSYESGDGSKASQSGDLKQIDKDNAVETVKGAFEYKGDDGKTYSLNYEADEAGYRAVGEHVPQIPPLIARALEYLATAPPPKER